MLRISFVLVIFLSLASAATAQPRQLGFSGPLSGPGAPWGTDVKNVLQFANEKLGQGRYSFIFEDDQCDLKTAITVSEKLSKVDKVKEVFVVCGQAVLVSAANYKRSNVVVMAPLATPSKISSLEVFRTSLSDALASRKLAEFIRTRGESVMVLTEQNEYPVSFKDDFLRSAKEIGLSASNEDFEPNLHDFRAILSRLKSKNISSLFLNTQTEGVLLSAVRQLKELGMSPQIYGAYLPGSAAFLKSAGPVADGIIFVDFPSGTELLTPEGKKLYEEYVSRYGAPQSWSFAFPAAFEAFRSIQQAIESGEGVDSYLHNKTFKGVFGKYSFNERGDIVGLQHVMREVRHGEVSLLPAASGK